MPHSYVWHDPHAPPIIDCSFFLTLIAKLIRLSNTDLQNSIFGSASDPTGIPVWHDSFRILCATCLIHASLCDMSPIRFFPEFYIRQRLGPNRHVTWLSQYSVWDMPHHCVTCLYTTPFQKSIFGSASGPRWLNNYMFATYSGKGRRLWGWMGGRGEGRPFCVTLYASPKMKYRATPPIQYVTHMHIVMIRLRQISECRSLMSQVTRSKMEWIMSHICTLKYSATPPIKTQHDGRAWRENHVTHMNTACHTSEYIMCVTRSRHTYEHSNDATTTTSYK